VKQIVERFACDLRIFWRRLNLCGGAGWNQTEDDLRRLVELAPEELVWAIEIDRGLAATQPWLCTTAAGMDRNGMTAQEYRTAGLARRL